MKSISLLLPFLLLNASALFGAPLHELKLKDIEGKEVALADYRGQALLIVNVASKCGLTRQYSGLEALYQKYKDDGLVVLGFPCNQFGNQEPGTNEEIQQFCSREFNVTFPLFDKIEVNGAGRAPLYDLLSGENSPFPGKIKWNFTKFLIGRDGTILQRFEPRVAADAPELVAAVEASLAVEYDRDAGSSGVKTSALPPEIQSRIAILSDMLADLENPDSSDAVSSPHAERQQDPAIIKEAIERLKAGEDICTRCLMACGAAS